MSTRDSDGTATTGAQRRSDGSNARGEGTGFGEGTQDPGSGEAPRDEAGARRRLEHIVPDLVKRGLYAGSVGYFSAAGEMDTCIVLRTALIKDGVMYAQAGAGIVADSNPDSEQTECINKSRALFRVAEEARRFASAAKRGQ